MPLPMLRAARREQLERACDIAPVIAIGQLAVGLVLLYAVAYDPVPWTAFAWTGAVAMLSAWLFCAARAMRGGRRARKLIFASAGSYAVLAGLVWGLAALVLAPPDAWTTATVLLGAGGVLTACSLLMAMLPSLSVLLCVTGGLAFFVSTVVVLPLGHAFSVSLLGVTFYGSLPLSILYGARGMVRRQQEGFLTRERHAKARYLLESHEAQGTDMLWECDAGLRMVRPSKRIGKLAGIEAERLDGMAAVSLLATAGVQPAGLAAILAALRARAPMNDVRMEMRDSKGRPAWWSISGRPQLDEHGEFKGFVGIGRDVTAEHLANRELVRMAETDQLTGLANRHVFRRRLAAAVARQGTARDSRKAGRGGDDHFAVLVLDLERFRSINATFGHSTGDAIIVEAARRILGCLEGRPEGSTCLARLAGDEFALMLDGTGKAGAARFSAAIAEVLARPFTFEERVVRTNARIGIALSPPADFALPQSEGGSGGGNEGGDEDEMLQRAELALACVKADGRGPWRFFEQDMAHEQNARAELERDLGEQLLDADAHFELLYQPLVEPADGQPRGMEALIRWNHPRLGTISPGTFIPMAERLGHIERIGRWSLETACREAASWGGPDAPRVAVNISAPHFAGGHLLDHVRSALKASGLAPDRLEIEVTESVLVDDSGEAERTLEGLHALGAQVALDDFGTGYSSLAYLQRFAFDKLKIDRRFIVTGEQDERSKHILAMIVELGRALDMTIVAEGIETPAQARMATKLGCDLLQGYLFARPMSAFDVRTLMDASAFLADPEGNDSKETPPRPKLKVVAA